MDMRKSTILLIGVLVMMGTFLISSIINHSLDLDKYFTSGVVFFVGFLLSLQIVEKVK